MTEAKGGKKFDIGKPDLSLIPLPALIEEAKGFMLGESKYGRYNYTEGMEASRLVAAALRHITIWMEGEDNDQESGASHLGHARCCLAMLIHTQQLGTLKDNRRTKREGESNGQTFTITSIPEIKKPTYEFISGSSFLDHIK
jgi:hypothetical protein